MDRAAWAGGQFWWHRLDLDAIEMHDLRNGFELRRATLEDLSLYEPLATDVNLKKTPEWLADGNDLWLAVHDGRAAFACWIYRKRMPMGEAEAGWLELPPGVAFLEHPVTAARLRGRGIAPACWSMMARSLAEEGERTLMTKIGETNEVAQRSMAKVGFQRARAEDPIVRDFQRQLGR